MNTTEVLALVEAGLEAIERIIQTVRDAKEGKVKPGDALQAITTMNEALAAGDAAADAALGKRFPA